MIISASRRTDIPAFYSEWFMNRIEDGYFFKVNPFNPNQKKGISLSPHKVDVIVFWTKYPGPLMEHLEELDRRGYQYYFQFTLNAYPTFFEPEMPSLKKRINLFQKLSDRIGKEKVIWRYDPIILSNVTKRDYHLEKFQYIANRLSNYTSRVIISFLDIYRKNKGKLNSLKKEKDIQVYDIVEYKYKKELISFSKRLREIAYHNYLTIQSCGEVDNVSSQIIPPGKCIDDQLISKVFDIDLVGKTDKNQRDSCLCIKAEDMGVYNTCKFNCTYCYATTSMRAVKNKLSNHSSDSSVLVGECEKKFREQSSLFD